MNQGICLDPNSINFNINSLSGNGFAIYTDADNFTSPIAVNIPASLLFPTADGNCQFSLSNIPAGANQILVVDQCDGPPPTSPGFPDVPSYDCCYALLTISENCFGWCNECDIEFDTADFNTVGRIIAGNLQSSCGPVTDYVIGWYKDGDYSAPVVTTGFGNAYNYQYTHPLTLTTGPLVSDGLYEGIILDVTINGVQYSTQVENAEYGITIPFESCFGTIVVAPFTCENGNFPLPYSHQINLTAEGNGMFPGPASATFLLSSSTDYFAYNFNSFAVYDTLKIKFISGDPDATSDPDLYSQSIYLEYARTNATNFNSSTNPAWNFALNNNNYPKIYSGQTFRKLISLTTLDRTEGDKLEIEITPNPNFPETSWQLKMQCLETVDCDWCYVGDSKLIQEIDIRRSLQLSGCDKKQKPIVRLSSSCNWNDDLTTYGGKYNYGNNSPAFIGGQSSQIYSYIFSNPGFDPAIVTYLSDSFSTDCVLISPSNYHNIGYKKYNGGITDPNGNPTGIIEMEFYGNPIAESTYLGVRSEIESVKNLAFPNQYQYGPDDFRYYRGWTIRMPDNNGNIPCGDNAVNIKTYYVHRDAEIEYLEIPSSNYWSIKIYMPYVDPVPQFQTLYTGGFHNCCGNPYSDNLLPIFQNNANGFNSSSISTTNLLDWTSNFSLRLSYDAIASPVGVNTLTTFTPPNPPLPCYSTNSIKNHSITGRATDNLVLAEMTTLPFIESLSSTTTNPQFVNLPDLKTTPCPIPSEILNNLGNDYSTIEWEIFQFSINFPDTENDPNTFNIKSRVPYPNNEGEIVPAFTVLEYTGSIGGGPGGISFIDSDYFVPGFNDTYIDFTNWNDTGPAPF